MISRAMHGASRRAGLFPLLVLCLSSCADLPKPGKPEDADRNRAEIRALIDQQAVRADAKEVHLRREALSQWGVTHVPLTSELLEKKLSTDKNRSYDNPYVYVHDRDIDWLCRATLMVPIYIRRNPASREFNERQYLSFGGGDCYRLIAPQKKFVAYVALFNLSIDLGAEMTRQKLLENIDDTLRYMEVTFYKALYNKTLERRNWEAHDVAIAERVGYYERSVNFLHAELYAVPTERYYRVLLTGKRTIALLTMTGSASASPDELHAYAVPILKALAYETP